MQLRDGTLAQQREDPGSIPSEKEEEERGGEGEEEDGGDQGEMKNNHPQH